MRPGFDEAAYRRSVADWTAQPVGMAGSGKRTTARKLSRGPLDWTLRMESDPLLLVGLFSSIQASAEATAVAAAPHPWLGGEIVQLWVAGVASRFPAASLARTAN